MVKNTTNWTADGEPETAEEVEQARLERERKKNKGKNNPEAPAPSEPTPPPVNPDNDITSIREATPEDPNGTQEIIIDNNDPSEHQEDSETPSQSPVEPSEPTGN